ncbi:MAG: MBL fold metallo-hydrolase [Candidatus Cloacimonetes bacterium]|nr:MBL fold metallo-hydrolase [Candidatus Cloacimonadota bacterium]
MPISVHKILAGRYWTDAGAFMGVMPRAIWSKKQPTDERHRFLMSLNLLLIRTPGRNILVDTGIGNRLSDRMKQIYSPDEFLLPVSLNELGLKDTDLTDVIMTHLHFDHAGGIITGLGNRDALTFSRATYWIQKTEWEMAKEPDELNRAAYNFEHQLALLDHIGKIKLIEGNTEICPGVRLVLTGGHSIGSQIIEVDADDGFYIYAGDIIPTKQHLHLAVTSAYDVSRTDTFKAKRYIYDNLQTRKGFLLLDHDNDHWAIHIDHIAY